MHLPLKYTVIFLLDFGRLGSSRIAVGLLASTTLGTYGVMSSFEISRKLCVTEGNGLRALHRQ